MKSEFGIAVHALVFLNHKQARLSSEAIAENVCTNPARVRKVLAGLRKSGLVDTREGADGGYRFIGPAEAVTLAEVLEASEVNLIESAWRSGDSEMKCLIASGMADIMDGIYELLNEVCMRELSAITVADIDQKIFGGVRK